MSLVIQCPQCNSRHQVSVELAGKHARCKCGATIAIPAAQPAAANAGKIAARCPSCGMQHQAPASLAGKAARCKCGAAFRVPAPAAAQGSPGLAAAPANANMASLFDDLTEQDLRPRTAAPQNQSAPRRTEAQILAQYMKADASQSPSPSDNGGVLSFEKRVFNGGVIGGITAMVAAVVWFVVGLAVGYIFFYPPVLFLLGLGAFIRGLVTGK